MKAYSSVLRERVAAACDASDATRKQIAARFSGSMTWFGKLMRQRRELGSIASEPRGCDRVRTSEAEADRLDGAGACLAFNGGTGTAALETYVGRHLAPTLRAARLAVVLGRFLNSRYPNTK